MLGLIKDIFQVKDRGTVVILDRDLPNGLPLIGKFVEIDGQAYKIKGIPMGAGRPIRDQLFISPAPDSSLGRLVTFSDH